ncbi:uncharacterized protein LOC120116958 [Hibiscus syriacus]|uniref:uncharacterized protein LOC120116958 n=1 Tax=Hibiscus syriacus TaxID=106335 RepID=UPI001921A129|nr:uncharacterized protein LOC120116958 [Hibiscus syriacus]
MAPYEALYGHRCRTPICWTELRDRKTLGPELVRETENIIILIRDRLKKAFDRQNCYADKRRKDIEFEVGDQAFLKVFTWKKVLRFRRKDPSYIIQLEDVELRLDLSNEEKLVQILDRDERVLRNKCIPMIGEYSTGGNEPRRHRTHHHASAVCMGLSNHLGGS